MKMMCILLIAMVSGMRVSALAQRKDILPIESRYHNTDIPFDPTTARIGDRACISSASGSYEHHVWVRSRDFYRNSSCIFFVQRIKGGWMIHTGYISIWEISSDSDFKRLGYIRMIEVSK